MSGYKLLIIESPGKLKKLRGILGPAWRIEASVGHVRDLPHEGGLHIGAAPDYRPTYEVRADRKDVVARLKRAAEGAEVWLGTDPDREGEAIAWHIARCLGLTAPKRVRFAELTERAVTAALAAPGTLDMALVGAQEARRVIDRLVGYAVSPVLIRRTGESLSAGRVQTPAVRLVVGREREIAAFRPQTWFAVRLHGGGGGGAWWLDLVGDGDDPDGLLLDRSVADRLALIESVAVRDCADTTERENPPPPLVTSTLQQLASVKLGLGAKAAMDLAQKLYEAGHITYHRTDNPNLGDDAPDAIARVARSLNLKSVTTLRRYPAPAGAQAGHMAISPTQWDRRDAGDDEGQRALYRLIWQRAVGSQLPEAQYAVRRVEAGGTDLGERGVTFTGVRRTLTAPGWRALVDGDERDEGRDEERDAESRTPNLLPDCRPGDWLRVVRGEVIEKTTRAPKRYTEASLIRRLEKEGLGRPSTYAAILETIKSRAYVELRKKRLHATARGGQLVDLVAGAFGFADTGYTRGIEAMLDGIATGAESYRGVVAAVWERLEDELTEYTAGEPQCARCGAPLQRLRGVSRKTKKPYDFWRCSDRAQACPETYPAGADGGPDYSPRLRRKAPAGGAMTERRG